MVKALNKEKLNKLGVEFKPLMVRGERVIAAPIHFWVPLPNGQLAPSTEPIFGLVAEDVCPGCGTQVAYYADQVIALSTGAITCPKCRLQFMGYVVQVGLLEQRKKVDRKIQPASNLILADRLPPGPPIGRR